jgi:hypothetical protein
MLPYTEAYDAIKSVPIVQAATVYDNRDTGETMILILNEAIWMGDQMEHTLINPNQLRAYGISHLIGQPIRPSTNLYLS